MNSKRVSFQLIFIWRSRWAGLNGLIVEMRWLCITVASNQTGKIDAPN